MKSALLANVALCLCPPIIATTAVVALPGARHAVHRLTGGHAPHHAKAAVHAAAPCPPALRAGPPDIAAILAGPAGPEQVATIIVPPVGPVTVPPVIVGGVTLPPLPPIVEVGPGPVFPGPVGPGPVGPSPVYPSNPGPPEVPSVPEPASWLMMVGGFFGVGSMIRRRRGGVRAAASPIGLAAELAGAAKMLLGGVPAGAHAGTIAAHTVRAALIKGATVCVCSGAILATAVSTVPPVARAIHVATTPAAPAHPTDCVV